MRSMGIPRGHTYSPEQDGTNTIWQGKTKMFTYRLLQCYTASYYVFCCCCCCCCWQVCMLPCFIENPKWVFYADDKNFAPKLCYWCCDSCKVVTALQQQWARNNYSRDVAASKSSNISRGFILQVQQQQQQQWQQQQQQSRQ